MRSTCPPGPALHAWGVSDRPQSIRRYSAEHGGRETGWPTGLQGKERSQARGDEHGQQLRPADGDLDGRRTAPRCAMRGVDHRGAVGSGRARSVGKARVPQVVPVPQSGVTMNAFEKSLRRVDAAQQRHTVPAFAFGVIKKYGDDNAGNLSVQLTYAMFVTVFPLLLLLVTVSNLVLGGHPALQQRVFHSAVGQFPIIGTQLAHSVHAMHRSSIVGLIVGVVGLVYGTTGLAQAGLFSMARIWNIPER